jgi:hypothetical protein
MSISILNTDANLIHRYIQNTIVVWSCDDSAVGHFLATCCLGFGKVVCASDFMTEGHAHTRTALEYFAEGMYNGHSKIVFFSVGYSTL